MPTPEKDNCELDDIERWQIEEIKKAVAEADRGEFATAEEVAEVFRRWTRSGRSG
jgi:RHH-type rel operon transcriptional repressor/antitoxin RelB